METVSLYSQFPRIIGYPIRLKIVNSLAELNDYIKENISKYDIHLSLYAFRTIIKKDGVSTPDYSSAIINKVYFDLDEGNWLQYMKDLHKWCLLKDIIHRMHLSSYEGGHFFIGCKPQVQYKKVALHNFQSWIIKKFDIEYDKGVSTLGDIARSFRVERTYNYKRECYCNPIYSEELLDMEYDKLNEYVEEPRKEKSSTFWYGSKLVNLRPFDEDRYMFKIERKGHVDVNNLLNDKQLIKLGIDYNKFPPCVRSWLADRELGYKGRHYLVLYLRDQLIYDLTDQQIISILKSILNKHRWLHCSTPLYLPGHNPGENLLPIKKTLHSTYKMYSCFQLQAKGHCPEKCGKWHPIYD